MTFHYSEQYPTENPELPQLREVIEQSAGDALTREQINDLCAKIGDLVSDTVPVLEFIDMSDSFGYEGAFETCSNLMIENLKKIGIEVKK